jgi:hypothetical protein
MPSRSPRSTHRYRKQRDQYVAACAQRGMPCTACGGPIAYYLADHRHPQGPSVDHGHELWQGGSLLDVTNWAIMHLRCNIQKSRALRRGTKHPVPFATPRSAAPIMGYVSRQW